MKCPKCGYLGFETGDRCRNCGYDFSLPELTRAGANHELLLKADSELDAATRVATKDLDLDRLIGISEPPSHDNSPDVPLFPIASASDDDLPLPRSWVLPRAPLAVRRSTPEPARAPVRQTPGRQPHSYEAPPLKGLGLPSGDVSDAAETFRDAGLGRRLGAVLVDLLIVGAIDASIVYFTLRLAGVDLAGYRTLPWAPLLSFFALLNGGYFITFAGMGGQTIGQMTFGLRVVGEDGAPVPFGTATLRTLAWFLCTLPLGLGLWFALSANHRALHDRLTATRVVLS